MHHAHSHQPASLLRTAIMATIHCLAGCAIGEILGLIIGTALGWSTGATIALAIGLAFVSGYALTIHSLRRSGLALTAALKIALAADTLSIGLMEIIDNALMLVIPGAMMAGLADPLFWGSMTAALGLAGLAALPLNYWLIKRGRGHALAHRHHQSDSMSHGHGPHHVMPHIEG